MKALGYIRFSSDSQANGSSIERQTESIKAYCQSKGLTLVDILTDDGISGFKVKHNNISDGKLGAFLNEVDKGKHQGTALVVEQMDRLTRQGMEKTNDLLARCINGGVKVHINGRVVEDLESLDTGIMNLVESWTAREYSKKLQNRVTKGLAERRAKFLKGEITVLTSLLPAWLESKDGKATPVKVASGSGKGRKIPASTVVAMFKLAAQGFGAPKILRELNGSGAGLSQVWINKTLRNRAVLGEFVSAGEIVHSYYPRIVDESLWQAARQAINSRNRRTSEERMRCVLGRSSDANLFAGLLFDITIPGKSYPLWYQRRGEQGTFLVTSTIAAARGEVHRIRYEKFESAFIRIITALNWAELMAEGEPAELTTVIVKQTELVNEMATLTSLINVRQSALDAAGDIEAISQIGASLKRLEDKQAIVQGQLDAITSEIDSARSKLSSLENPAALMDVLNQPEKRAQLRLEISKRITKIELLLGSDPWMVIHFANKGTRFVNINEDSQILVALKERNLQLMRESGVNDSIFAVGGFLVKGPVTKEQSNEVIKDFIRERNRKLISA